MNLVKYKVDRSMCRNCCCHHQYVNHDTVETPCIYCGSYMKACYNYEPQDNLEYLEYLYDKRTNTI